MKGNGFRIAQMGWLRDREPAHSEWLTTPDGVKHRVIR